MKNFYLAIKDVLNQNVSGLWSSSKTYYEENGKKVNEWIWSDPWICENNTIDEILAKCQENPPSVFGFSVYTWNEPFMDELSKRVKEQHPNCLIVYGGPQVNIKYDDDFFINNYWIDAVCPSDGYGEITIQDLLDHYPVKDFNDITYIYYTNEKREKLLSTKNINKRSFKWPKNVFKAQEKFLLTDIQKIKQRDPLIVVWGTTRGCPYSCIYCDWGGGIQAKVNKKPYDTIVEELTWLAQQKTDVIILTDANFGITQLDLKITELFIKLNKEYGYPKGISIDAAKNNLDRTEKIYHMLLEHNMLIAYKIAVQTLNPVIKANIKRTDVEFPVAAASTKRMKKDFPDLSIRLQTILGLPGDSYEATIRQIEQLIEHGVPVTKSATWILLPQSPAASPELKEKFKIETVNKTFNTAPIIYKPGVPIDPGVLAEPGYQDPSAETVVATYSYSKQEWLDMSIINSLGAFHQCTGIHKHLVPYLRKEHDMSVFDLYDFIFKNFFSSRNSFNNDNLNSDVDRLLTCLERWMFDPEYQTNSLDYDPDFPFLLTTSTFTNFILLLNFYEYCTEVCNKLAIHLKDDKLKSLGHYLGSIVTDINYNADLGREIESEYDWLNYFDNSSPLILGKYLYSMTDRYIVTNHDLSHSEPMGWHQQEVNSIARKKQFYLQLACRINGSHFSKTLELKTQ